MHIKTVLLTSTTFLKLAALVLAFFLWSMLSDLYVMSMTYTVPVTIKPSSHVVIAQKPDTVTVTVRGLRKYVRSVDPKNLFVSVDPMQLSEGPNHISVTAANLGLPNMISVVDYTPMNVTIVAEQHDKDAAAEHVDDSHATPQQRI